MLPGTLAPFNQIWILWAIFLGFSNRKFNEVLFQWQTRW